MLQGMLTETYNTLQGRSYKMNSGGANLLEMSAV